MWRLWYEDGTTFSSTDGQPWESPPFGVIVIGQRTTVYHEILCSGVPWYIYREDEGFWQELDEGGFLDQISHNAHHISAVRFGRYTRKDRFLETMRVARQWVTYGE